MMKHEFESLALRGRATIPALLYVAIERYYMDDDTGYHRLHGIVGEDKAAFVRRVFGGKVNTPRSVARKIAAEARRRNRWALQGAVSEARLREMDGLIDEHYDNLLRFA